MAGPDALTRAQEEARLHAEAAHLTEELAAAGDGASDEAAAALARSRMEILARIAELGAFSGPEAEGEDPAVRRARAASRQALERIRELDRGIIGRLQARVAAVRRELESARKARETFGAYRGSSRPSPRYLDRLG